MKNFVFILFYSILMVSCIGPFKELDQQIDDIYFTNDYEEIPKQINQNFKNKIKINMDWSINLGDINSFFSLAFDDDNIYTFDESNNFCVINKKSSQIQKYNIQKIVKSGPVIGKENIFFVDNENKLNALTKNGELLWSVFIDDAVNLKPVTSGDYVLLKSRSENIYAYNEKTGEQVWKYSNSSPPLTLLFQSNLKVQNNIIFSGSPGGKLNFIDINNGTFMFQSSISKSVGVTEIERTNDISRNIAFIDNFVYASTYNGDITGVDFISGKQTWTRKISSIHGLLSYEKNLFLLHEDDSIYSFDYLVGKSLWKNSDLSHRKLSQLIATNDYLITLDSFGFLFVIDIKSGELLAQKSLFNEFNLDVSFNSRINLLHGINYSELFIDNNSIYILLKSGQIFKVKLDD